MKPSELTSALIEAGLSEKAARNIASQVDRIQYAIQHKRPLPPLTDEQRDLILSYEPDAMLMPFGKHKGETVLSLAESHEGKGYLTWAIRNWDAETTDQIIAELRRGGFNASIQDGIR